MQTVLTDCSEIDAEIETMLGETEVIAGLVESCVNENSRSALDQTAYLARYNGLVDRYETAKAKVDALQKRRSERLKKADAIGGFMFALSERDSPLDTFTDGLWIDSVDLVTVHADGTMTFRFLNGSEINV